MTAPTACCNPHCPQRPDCHRAQLHDEGHPVSFHYDLSMREKQGYSCLWPVERRETA